MILKDEKIKWFRNAAGYIAAHKGKSFVICLCKGATESSALREIISDCILLISLGVRIIIVFNGDEKIEKRLRSDWDSHNNKHITRLSQISTVSEIIGSIRNDLEAFFAFHSFHLPGGKQDILLTSGNFVKAKPIGIINGVNYEFSGQVRKVNAIAIQKQLETNSILLISPIGFAPEGDLFHLDSNEVATEVASSIKADKLIFLNALPGLLDGNGEIISEIDLSTKHEANEKNPLLKFCQKACNNGVSRCHILSHELNGALLQELFTPYGCGTQVTGTSSEKLRQAKNQDLDQILDLIGPSENEGSLIQRTRDGVKAKLAEFFVIESDGFVVACAALHPYQTTAEIACMVTHPDYRDQKRGINLLDYIEKKGKELGLESLFVLTTKSEHWFKEKGFSAASLDELPQERRDEYKQERSSIILRKKLS